nr:unnamed protein product [Spirometra erinaceieuropaei]
MNLVDTEDCSSPSSFRIGLSRARRKNQMFGAYEEALSVSIRYLRQAPRRQEYPAHSLPLILVSAITDCDVLNEMFVLHGGFVLRAFKRRHLERACSIPSDLVDAKDCSSPSSSRIGLRARRKNQMFGAYEEALSVSIRYLRQAPRRQEYPAYSRGPLVATITDYDALRGMLVLRCSLVLGVFTK